MILHTVYICIFLSSCAGLSLEANADSGNGETDIAGLRVRRSRTFFVRQGLLFARGLLARKKILKGAKFIRADGKITHYEKSGGYSQMKADFQYAAKSSQAQISVRDGTFQGNVDFGDMTIKYVGNKALPGTATDEPVLKILLKDENGEVFRENWVHYTYIDNVDR